MNATTPAPARQRKPRPKPARSIWLVLAPTHTMPGICRITVRRGRTVEATDYHLAGIPSDFGRAFRLVKILGEHTGYHVNLDGERSSCECKGHLAHGHCKHVDGLAALVRAGRL